MIRPSAAPAAPPSYDHAPVIVIWEATRACSLACRHCRADAVTEPAPDELTDGEARDLLDHVRAEFGPCVFVITGGDPLERPGVLGVARHGADLGLRMAITPAATPLLDRDAMRRIADAGIATVALSIDGADEATHDGFRRVEGTWERTIEAFAWAHAAGLSTQMNTSFGRHNAHQVRRLAEVGALCGIALWSAFILVPTGRATQAMLLDPVQHERLYRELADVARDPATPFAVKTTAGQPFYRVLAQSADAPPRRRGRGVNDGNGFVFVGHDGAIAPSGFLPLVRGNVRRDRLADVYRRDPVFVRLRRPATFAGKCGRCGFNAVCGGSRSRTWALTGDPFGSDPTCLYQPPPVTEIA